MKKVSDFEKFCFIVSGENWENFNQLRAIIGRAILPLPSFDIISSGPMTGKGIIAKAVSFVRSDFSFLSGRSFMVDAGQKCITNQHIIVDDVPINDIDDFALYIENNNWIMKCFATTGTNRENDSRCHHLDSPYCIEKTPVSDFNKHFFQNWNGYEWMAFYQFMESCKSFANN